MEPQFRATCQTLRDTICVDNITGTASEEVALQIYAGAMAIFEAALMSLHKLTSNTEVVTRRTPSLQRADHWLGQVAGVLKVLGLI